MTDIVERLRKFCKWPEPGDGIPDDPVFANVPDLKEAADEIERLRAEVARGEASILAWVEAVGECNKDRHRLRAENAALRAALQWMVDNDETNEGDEPMPEYGGQTWNGINAYYIAGLNRARDALGEGRHDKPAALLEDER